MINEEFKKYKKAFRKQMPDWFPKTILFEASPIGDFGFVYLLCSPKDDLESYTWFKASFVSVIPDYVHTEEEFDAWLRSDGGTLEINQEEPFFVSRAYKPKYKLEELVQNTDFEAQRNDPELHEWMNSKPVGKERLDEDIELTISQMQKMIEGEDIEMPDFETREEKRAWIKKHYGSS